MVTGNIPAYASVETMQTSCPRICVARAAVAWPAPAQTPMEAPLILMEMTARGTMTIPIIVVDSTTLTSLPPTFAVSAGEVIEKSSALTILHRSVTKKSTRITTRSTTGPSSPRSVAPTSASPEATTVTTATATAIRRL